MGVNAAGNLKSVWRKAGDLPVGTLEQFPETARFEDKILIQDEPRIRIFFALFGEKMQPGVTKIYRTPCPLTWRDLFRIPVAQREFQNLRYARGRKLPVAESLECKVQRSPGRDWFSLITTGFLDGCTMREVLGRAETTNENKAGLVRKSAKLLALMHREGLVWGTAHTGNFMVHPQTDGALTAFDLPYALCTGKDMRSSALARYDLHTMVSDFRRLCGLDEQMVDTFFRAYAEEANMNPDTVRRQFDEQSKRRGFKWSRVWLRTLSSFRLRP